MENQDKPKVLLPGDSQVLDGYTPYIRSGRAIGLALFIFVLITSLVLLFSWRNIPGLPVPEGNRPPYVHVLQYFNHWFLGKIINNESNQYYGGWINHLTEIKQIHLLAIRHIAATLIGGFFAYKAFMWSWVVEDNQKQIRGKKLLRGTAAFKDLKAIWDRQIGATVSDKFPKGKRGMILATDKGFQPNKKETFDKSASVLRMPDSQRRVHFMYLGGSRRGKGVSLKQMIMQVYFRIRNGAKDKLLIIDTPKGEYAWLFKQKYTTQIAPDERHQSELWIARDLEFEEDIASYWAGRIPTNDKDPYWTDSARIIGIAIMVYLRSTCGEDWNFAHFAYWRDQPRAKLIEIAREYYPDALKTLEAPEQTVATHLSTLSINSRDAILLSKIWNGFHLKKEIHQMSVALLKKPFWQTWFVNTAYPLTRIVTKDEEEVEEAIPANNFTHYLMVGLIKHLNYKGDWTWKDLKKLLSKPLAQQVALAQIHTLSDRENFGELSLSRKAKFFEFQSISYTLYSNQNPVLKEHAKFVKPYITSAELWDKYESTEKFSLRDWILDEDPKKKIVLIKPSGRFKSQTESLIRGMLFFMTGLVNDKFYDEDKSSANPNIRRLHIVCDEFQSLGNMEEFIGPGMEMFASKGVTIYLACQSLSQVKKIYGEDMLAFFLSNTGNIFIMGVNMGADAEMIANQLGKKYVLKQHISTTYSDTGKSSSVNHQEHEGVVMTPDEVNELGTKEEPNRTYVRYLYLPSNLSNAYILEAEISNYPVLYKPTKAAWLSGEEGVKPLFVTEKEIIAMLSKAAPVAAPVEVLPSLPGMTKAPPSPVVYRDDPDDDTGFDLDDELEDEPNYAAQFLQEASTRVETQEVYYLEQEEEPLEGSIAVDFAIESMLDSPILHALKSVAEVKDKSSTPRTTDKKAWVASMLKKKHEDYNTVDRETQR